MKADDATNRRDRGSGGSPAGGILGDRLVTERRLLEEKRSSQSFRGDVGFVSPAAAPESDLYRKAEEICPSEAIAVGEAGATIDIGRCIMCGMCQEVASGAFKVESGFARPVTRRRELVIAQVGEGTGHPHPSAEEIGGQLREEIRRVLGRSLAVREVDAGSCNGCEVEVAALNNPIYDIERFGVHFVASPRHADVLLVTGVASRNMEWALKRTFEATPDPKVVVAVGACACSGGIFGDTYASSGGIGEVVPVDVYVPGCPPRPEALLYGLLLAVGRIS